MDFGSIIKQNKGESSRGSVTAGPAYLITETAARRLRREQRILSRYTGERVDLHLKQEEVDAINY